jgi:hypothetical protein
LVHRAFCAPSFLICREGPDPRAHNPGAVPLPHQEEEAVSSQPPDERPLLRPLFVILLCTGYLYVAFFFFLMFRTILLPEHFAR